MSEDSSVAPGADVRICRRIDRPVTPELVHQVQALPPQLSVETDSSSSRSSTPGEDSSQASLPRPVRSRIMPESSERDIELSTARPVKAETFCDCLRLGKEKDCRCGEDDRYFEWNWDDDSKSSATILRADKREVVFHTDYSCGTAAVRGSQSMKDEQYFWEVKMTTPVYGTDMMVGVGTQHTDLDKYKHIFCSLIGRDGESWGLSYCGSLHHKSLKKAYASKFGQGSIIGVHLDMWHGMLSFYKNRKPLGVAFRGLQGKTLFPMVSSTAARSGMKVVTCRSFRTSLQFMCCQVLRRLIPNHLNVLEALTLPPGLCAFLENNMGWLLQSCFGPQCGPKGGQKRSRDDMENDSEKEASPPGVKRARVEATQS
ncbi:SPRY domain-containing SOCS box protein 3-like [Haliotis rufescens]|uniref:SPRY domain-containing SOCS box protein 3-like n=1 Tax=Haliotis rufescens TaxID=6454 RepID=UPI00201F0FCD|nr:SPRY domain-containing SOCS box protein 3-like [Haliotis rufescens]